MNAKKSSTYALNVNSTMSFESILGKKMLIVGDLGTGKTALTMRLLNEALERGYKQEITVIEMAPKMTKKNGLVVGGKLIQNRDKNVRVLESKNIRTPRLSAKNPEELIGLAEHNRKEIEELIEKFAKEPTNILFINDISVYLQCGDLERLWKALEKAETIVTNGYIGEKLREDFGTRVSERERQLMYDLASRMDVFIEL